MLRFAPFAALAALALAALPLDAHAQSYRCVGKDGKKYYGQTIPRECIGQTIEQLSAQGTVIRRIQHETPEQKAARLEEEKKKKEQAEADREETRRNRALLATYQSEKDIDAARARALKQNEQAVKEVEAAIASIKKRQAELAKEMEFHKGKKPPAKLVSDVKTAEVDLEAQQNLLRVKQKEADQINNRFDEDKKRYAELTKRR